MKLQMKWLGILVVLLMLVMAAAPASADTGKPSLAVTEITVSPSAFMSGDTGTVTITLMNPSRNLAGDSSSVTDTYNYGTGTSTGSGGVVPITHSTTTQTSSSNTPDGSVNLKEVTLLADSPVHVVSKNFNDLGPMGMGNSAKLTFTITVDSNTPDGTYFLTLKVRTGDDGIYLNYPVSITVDNSPLKMVINDAPTLFSRTKQSVILDIVNLRPNAVQGVGVMPSGDDFAFKPQQEYIVGNIGAGEMYTVQFDVTSKNATYSGNPSFKVVYMNGENLHQAEPVTVYSDHAMAAAAAPAGGDNNALLYVLGIILADIVIIGGIYVYMRGKRTKR
jgi:hypothetical protein